MCTGYLIVEKELWKSEDVKIAAALYDVLAGYAGEHSLLTASHKLHYNDPVKYAGCLDADFTESQDKEMFLHLAGDIVPKEILEELSSYFGTDRFNRFRLNVSIPRDMVSIMLSASLDENNFPPNFFLNTGRQFLFSGTVLSRETYSGENGEILSTEEFLRKARAADGLNRTLLGQVYDIFRSYLTRYDKAKASYDEKKQILKIVFPRSAMYEQVDRKVASYFCLPSSERSAISSISSSLSITLKTKADAERFFKMFPDCSCGSWWEDMDENLNGFEVHLYAKC